MNVLHRSAVLLAPVLLALSVASGPSLPETAGGGDIIGGPFSSLLAASTNLGPSHAEDAQVTVKLPAAERPGELIGWAGNHHLAVRWRPGDDWAIVSGSADSLGAAFEVPVQDFRGRQGQTFYASPLQPAVPSAVRGDVSAVGRILSYFPHRTAYPIFPRDVPRPGLTPKNLLTAYNATPLADAGYTGKGQTLVIFAFDGFDQADLDMFADMSKLPRFTPEVIDGPLGEAHGETTMDLEVAHAIAPDADMVVINALPTVAGGGTFEKIGQMFDNAAQRYPNSVWSLSIGWGCEALATAADMAPVRTALVKAHRKGIAVFDASGDTAGLECKGGKDWSTPPGPADVGVDAVASLPEMTSVGGTTLSTDMAGRWMDERAWIDAVLSQGTGGGVSRLFARPDYQVELSNHSDVKNRLVPDVSAVGDPFTGVQIVYDKNLQIGGGTSQSAPIWAGFTVLMNQYAISNGGRTFGDINPLLYQIARGSVLPGFQDITLGGNAVGTAIPGYDFVTGLGSPNVDNLARNLLAAQKARSAASDYLSDGG